MTVLNGNALNSESNNAGEYALSNIELERRSIRKKQNLKSVLTSIISTLVLLGVCIVALAMSPGWPRVRET
ncbi:ABC transporter permease, partial [Gardnerella vaginalis]